MVEQVRLADAVAASAPARTAQQHMRESLRRFSRLVAETARTTRPADVPPELIQLFALSVVGTLEQVIVEWENGHLNLPVEGIIDHCTGLARASLAAIDSGAVLAGRDQGRELDA